MKYKELITESMKLLADNKYIFIGQSCRFQGTGLFWTLEKVPMEQRIELPVFEDVQMGMSIGMSLEGMKVCSIYPRWDFLILALNQLVNHADRIEEMSDGQFKPNFIIRTAVGSVKPLFPGPQHTGDYSDAVQKMCKKVKVVKLKNKKDIINTYKKAMKGGVWVIVEYPDLYES